MKCRWREVVAFCLVGAVFGCGEADEKPENSIYPVLVRTPNSAYWQFFDAKGKPITDDRFDDVNLDCKPPYPVHSRLYWHYFGKEGLLNSEKFVRAACFHPAGNAKVLFTSNVFRNDIPFAGALIDSSGRWVLKPVPGTDTDNLSEGIFPVTDCRISYKRQPSIGIMGSAGVYAQSRCQWGYEDEEGKVVLRTEYLRTYPFAEGLGHVVESRQGRHGYVDKSGNVVIQAQFSSATSFSGGLAAVGKRVSDRELFGYIDAKGAFKIEAIYETADPFSEGLAKVKRDGKVGFLDSKGVVAIPLNYQDAKAFSEGLAAVFDGRKWGYVNKKGENIVPFKFDKAWNFQGGLAHVESDDAQYIDRKGRPIFDRKGNYVRPQQ